MTKKEAIKILKSKMDGSVDTSYEWAEAVRMAIEALSAEAEQVTGKLRNPDDSLLTDDTETCKEQKSKLDLISRQSLCRYALNQKDKSVTPNDIMRFPSAEPKTDGVLEQVRWERDVALKTLEEHGIGLGEKPRTGKWVKDALGMTVCSECRRWRRDNRTSHVNFCNSCGVRMIGSEETSTINEKHQLSEKTSTEHTNTSTVFIDRIGHFPKLSETSQSLTKPNKSCEADLIRRQDAIDELKTFIEDETTQFADQIWNGAIKTAIGCMRMVPTSAEPNYTGCHGCIHYDQQQTALICHDCKRYYRDRYEDGEAVVKGADNESTL